MDFIDVLFCKRVLTKLENNGIHSTYNVYNDGAAVSFILTLDDGHRLEKDFTLRSLNNCREVYPEVFVAQDLLGCVRDYYNVKPHDEINALPYFKPVNYKPRSTDLIISSISKIDLSGLNYSRAIDKVIFNDPATIVFWKDGSKTVTKCGELDIYDPEKGLAMCFAKKLLGNEGNYYNVFTKWLPKEEENDVEYGCPFDEPPIYRQVKEACDKIYDKITNGGY